MCHSLLTESLTGSRGLSLSSQDIADGQMDESDRCRVHRVLHPSWILSSDGLYRHSDGHGCLWKCLCELQSGRERFCLASEDHRQTVSYFIVSSLSQELKTSTTLLPSICLPLALLIKDDQKRWIQVSQSCCCSFTLGCRTKTQTGCETKRREWFRQFIDWFFGSMTEKSRRKNFSFRGCIHIISCSNISVS